MQISKRLRTIASFVTEGSSIVDIGTDHGYIPILLMKQGKIKKALAMDINQGPLERAKEHIREQGLSDKIEIRLSDGFRAFREGEANTVIIAGMGGALTQRILQEGREALSGVKEFILSPQSELKEFRHFLQDFQCEIIKETMIKEEGKYYTIIKAQFGSMQYTKEIEYLYGKLLLEERNPILREYLQKEKKACLKILKQLSFASGEEKEERKKQILHNIQKLKEAETYYEM